MSAVAGRDFEVDGKKYSSGRMDAFTQFSVASKLTGILLLMKKQQSEAATAAERAGFVRAFCALASDLRKEDSDFVFRACLAVVKRHEEAGQAPMMDAAGGMMYEDVNFKELLEIVWEVLVQHRIPDFFAAPAPATGGTKPAA